MSAFNTLLQASDCLKLDFQSGSSSLALCPNLGGRIFAEVCGIFPHRLDMETVKNPTDDFNNFGGGNFWPAPEGGVFGFNYDGDTWRVQEAINLQPFDKVEKNGNFAVIQKQIDLINRAGNMVKANMKRELEIVAPPVILNDLDIDGWICYRTVDSFNVINRVSVEEALMSSWTLEQFAATNDTVSFCKVENSQSAINFDFYDHPGERIVYYPHGFTYKTDGKKAGQIGIKKDSNPLLIGFYDLQRNLLCIRENLNIGDGTYFNIADNNQPGGPYSAADVYSIYNSDPEMAGFELETIGGARIEEGILKGSVVISRTTIAVLQSTSDLRQFVSSLIGE